MFVKSCGYSQIYSEDRQVKVTVRRADEKSAKFAHVRMFGSRVHACIAEKNWKKLDKKSEKSVVLPSLSHGKYLIWLEHDARVETTRNCKIAETEFPARLWPKNNLVASR